MVYVKVCCANTCSLRFSCLFFSKAIDYVQGKIGGEYEVLNYPQAKDLWVFLARKYKWMQWQQVSERLITYFYHIIYSLPHRC